LVAEDTVQKNALAEDRGDKPRGSMSAFRKLKTEHSTLNSPAGSRRPLATSLSAWHFSSRHPVESNPKMFKKMRCANYRQPTLLHRLDERI
jgi:hypothetical protein